LTVSPQIAPGSRRRLKHMAYVHLATVHGSSPSLHQTESRLKIAAFLPHLKDWHDGEQAFDGANRYTSSCVGTELCGFLMFLNVS
jgi:hypothetical protein